MCTLQYLEDQKILVKLQCMIQSQREVNIDTGWVGGDGHDDEDDDDDVDDGDGSMYMYT